MVRMLSIEILRLDPMALTTKGLLPFQTKSYQLTLGGLIVSISENEDGGVILSSWQHISVSFGAYFLFVESIMTTKSSIHNMKFYWR